MVFENIFCCENCLSFLELLVKSFLIQTHDKDEFAVLANNCTLFQGWLQGNKYFELYVLFLSSSSAYETVEIHKETF